MPRVKQPRVRKACSIPKEAKGSKPVIKKNRKGEITSVALPAGRSVQDEIDRIHLFLKNTNGRASATLLKVLIFLVELAKH